MEEFAGTPQGLTRREFLTRVGVVGGATALYGSMEALGLVASPANAETLDFVPPRSGDFPPGPPGKHVRVAVLGAGTAGLTVAYELGKAGYDCHVLEADNRPGGRALSVRRGFTHTDTDGVTQVCEYDEGQYFNAGPSLGGPHPLALGDGDPEVLLGVVTGAVIGPPQGCRERPPACRVGA